MSSTENFLGSKTWTLPIGNGTLTIALSFIFLAYILHPAIESAYHRLRAYRAWRSIQKRNTVEVTTYPMLAEVCGGRGVWDAARIITVLLFAFSLASWGLELSMDLASLEGEADLLNRPPPVFLLPETNDTTTDPWQVLTLSQISPGYDGNWRSLGDLNVKETLANSRYYIVKDTNSYLGSGLKDTYKNGEILVASWSTAAEDRPKLFYDTNGATVDSLECSGETLKRAAVYLGVDEWGTALDCERGPRPSAGASAPPAIILTDAATGKVHIVVEESSSYPTFLYSVWTASSADSDSVELEYSFHIASNGRLAEAVVTGIVHGETDGGGCFGLLRAFSETREPYEDVLERASPFGEHPTGDTVQVQELENLDAGVEIDMNALLCLIWLMALTAVGIAWSICLRSSIGMDVYDRDELLRAVSLQGQASKDPTAEHPAIRIYVQREDSGNMTVFINDAGGDDEVGWRRFLRRGGPTKQVDDPAPDADTEAAQVDDNFGGAVVPVDGTVSLGGTRTGTMTPLPGRERVTPRTPLPGGKGVTLNVSPVPSAAGSVAATPVHSVRSLRRNPFDTVHSPDSSTSQEESKGEE